MKSLQSSDWTIPEESYSDTKTNKKETSNTDSAKQNDTKKDQKRTNLPDCPCVYGLIFGLLFSGIILTIVIAIWMTSARKATTSSNANATTSPSSSTTCIGKETPYHTSIITVLYPFDGNANDLSGSATGITFGGPAYSTYAYVGSMALVLVASSQQYVQIPYVNLAQRSFTLETWVYTSTITIPSDFGIFSQCDSNLICLSLSLRNGRFALSFDAMNTNNYTLIGSTMVSTYTWVHVTVVYDSGSSQQKIYVNGRIDAESNTAVSSYQGTSSGSTTTIGRSISSVSGTSYLTGRIDQFTISAGTVRTTCQIYNDASLIAYYPFDTTGTYDDYSTALANGVTAGTTVISAGHIGQAISFSSNTSYFQSHCFPKMLGNAPSFSFSLWVNPTSTSDGGTLVHLSTTVNGTGNCYDLLVFTVTGNLVMQWMLSSSTVNSTQGPVISASAWTHVAVVYGVSNGIRLFINGQFSTSSLNTANMNLLDTLIPLYMTLGNVGALGPSSTIICQNGSIPISSGPFPGAIDDFRLYNRELTSQEIYDLVNM